MPPEAFPLVLKKYARSVHFYAKGFLVKDTLCIVRWLMDIVGEQNNVRYHGCRGTFV